MRTVLNMRVTPLVGWTQVATNTGTSSAQLFVFQTTADGSEGGTMLTWTLGASRKTCFVFAEIGGATGTVETAFATTLDRPRMRQAAVLRAPSGFPSPQRCARTTPQTVRQRTILLLCLLNPPRAPAPIRNAQSSEATGLQRVPRRIRGLTTGRVSFRARRSQQLSPYASLGLVEIHLFIVS